MAKSSNRVYFYTGSFTHTFYKELYKYPPEGFEYIPSSPELLDQKVVKRDIAQSKHRLYPYRRYAEQLALKSLTSLKIPKIRRISAPQCSLIHSAQYPLLNKQPWVVDFEDASAFAWYSPKVLRSAVARRALQKIFASPYCRAILPWTEAAKSSLLNSLDCSKFGNKIHIVYPTITPQTGVAELIKKRRADSKIRLLFVGTAFLMKGGLETAIVVDRLAKKYPVECAFVSNVPNEYLEKYKNHPAMKFYSKIPNEQLQELYKTSHLFLAPYHTDTFGFVILEAFSCGLPCVATNQFAIPEIITDGRTGRVFGNSISRFGEDFLPGYEPAIKESDKLLQVVKNPPADYLNRFEQALESLLKDRVTLGEMGLNAYAEITDGKFSAKTRQATLELVYEQALK